jgi:hypothetical protein
MTDTAAEVQQTEAPTLGLQDIENTLKIIDFAAEQGAFKGWNTIQQVLAVRGKIAAFLTYAQENAEQPAEDTTPADATA